MTEARPFDDALTQVKGFGNCPICKFLSGGPATLCYLCARQTMEPLAPEGDRCPVCDQTFIADETDCRNPVCAMGERWFGGNYATAMRSGVLEAVMNTYKGAGPASPNRGWSAIFGRILVGFLDANEEAFDGVDLIVASPTYLGPGSRHGWDRIRAILEAADTEQSPTGRWAFDLADPPAVVKLAETESLVGKSYRDRRTYAEDALRAALHVPNSGRVEGKQIIVVDDLFTDGLTLREVARVLVLDGGAARVDGVSLARQPFGRRPTALISRS